jgi:hypothetical protein
VSKLYNYSKVEGVNDSSKLNVFSGEVEGGTESYNNARKIPLLVSQMFCIVV